MNGRSYWIIPLIFSVIFIETGFIFYAYIGIFMININGQISYGLPPNWQLWYNTFNGSFFSIFLSNFIWDGWSNLIGFLIYSLTFIVVVVLSPHRVQRSWFLIVGAVLSAIIAGSVIRFFLPAKQIVYGQSAVLAGFAGIVVVFGVVELIRLWRNDLFTAGYFGVFIFCLIFAVSALYGFFISSVLSAISIQVHLIALLSGVILAGLSVKFLEKPAGKGEGRGRKAPLLITEDEGRSEGSL